MSEPARQHQQRFAVRAGLVALFALMLAFGLFVLASFSPANNPFYPRCMSYTITGLHCPGCGTTRALHAALNGRFEQAVAYNLFMPLMVPLIGYQLLLIGWRMLWPDRQPKQPVSRRAWLSRVIWGLMILLVLYGVLRNLPWEPFTWLAPHELTQ